MVATPPGSHYLQTQSFLVVGDAVPRLAGRSARQPHFRARIPLEDRHQKRMELSTRLGLVEVPKAEESCPPPPHVRTHLCGHEYLGSSQRSASASFVRIRPLCCTLIHAAATRLTCPLEALGRNSRRHALHHRRMPTCRVPLHYRGRLVHDSCRMSCSRKASAILWSDRARVHADMLNLEI